MSQTLSSRPTKQCAKSVSPADVARVATRCRGRRCQRFEPLLRVPEVKVQGRFRMSFMCVARGVGGREWARCCHCKHEMLPLRPKPVQRKLRRLREVASPTRNRVYALREEEPARAEAERVGRQARQNARWQRHRQWYRCAQRGIRGIGWVGGEIGCRS